MNDYDSIDPHHSSFQPDAFNAMDDEFCRLDDICTVLGESAEISRVLVINLDRQRQRWDEFQNGVQAIQVQEGKRLASLIERIKAIDGLATPVCSYVASEITRAYSLEDFYFVDPQPILSRLMNRNGVIIEATPQEMAVAQSHLNVWKQIAGSKQTTMVVEDDARFVRSFGSKLNQLWTELAQASSDERGFDLLYLSYRPVQSGIRKNACSKMLFRPLGGLWWLSGYLLTPEGARKLLALLPINGPVDQWVNHQIKKLRVYASSTPLIVQRRPIASDNSYSVIPVLRAIRGAVMSSDGSLHERSINQTRVATEHRDHSSECPRQVPVFAIGLNKTGTTSLHRALEVLGYKSCHWQSDDFSHETGKLIDSGLPLPFEAYTDVASIVGRYKDLDRQYPTAAFILTTRDLDDWLASRARHVALNRAANHINAQRGQQNTHSWTDLDPVAWRNERILHHEEVLRYFKNRPEKLLVLDICGGDGWRELCHFLNCPISATPFPHVDPLDMRKTTVASSPQAVSIRKCKSRTLQQDDYPWILKPEKQKYSPEQSLERLAEMRIVGKYVPIIADDFRHFDTSTWTKLGDTFETNLAVFRPRNVSLLVGGGIAFTLQAEECQDRSYTAGAISSPIERASYLMYGRFEAEIMPAHGDGILTGMFLHRRDPWQEIDLEFLGNRSDQLLINVYYNPGEDGDLYNYGMRGTPVLIDLGFDASKAFHHYAIEWDPCGIRWFVDGNLVFARADAPTPVPHLPMRFYLNTWPIDAQELAGKLNPSQLPALTKIRSIALSSWIPHLPTETVDCSDAPSNCGQNGQSTAEKSPKPKP
jgi:GR25 family glycosyltransferase involved in LPS biosynthesis